MKVIQLTGNMFSGKDYISRRIINILLEQGYSVFKTAFAWKLKDNIKKGLGLTKERIVNKLLPWNEARTNLIKVTNETASNSDIEEYPLPFIFDVIKNEYENIFNGKDYNTNIRGILQKYGTEIVRNYYDKNFWVNYIKHVIELNKEHVDYFFITDYRFPNEGLKGSYKIKVIAPIEERSERSGKTIEEIKEMQKHDSEKFIENIVCDIEINNSTCSDNKEYITKILNDIEGDKYDY